MTQRDIDRAVARATGETVGRVHQMGFTLIVVSPQSLRRRRATGKHCSSTKTLVADRLFAARHAAQA
jgi:hypothetical protein